VLRAPQGCSHGVLQAQALLKTLSERWSEAALRIATTPAKTKEGLIAKLAMAWPAYGGDRLDGTYDGVVASVVRDAHALANTVAPAGKDASSWEK
jgi:hypothetical protein